MGTERHLHSDIAVKLIRLWDLYKMQERIPDGDKYLSKEVVRRFRTSHFGKLMLLDYHRKCPFCPMLAKTPKSFRCHILQCYKAEVET